MKRLILLIVIGVMALSWLRASSHRSMPPRRPHAIMVAQDVRPVDPDGPREVVDGLPVPVFPGSRVTDAEIRPPQVARKRHVVVSKRAPRGAKTDVLIAPPTPPTTPTPPPTPTVNTRRTVAGRLSATEPRAKNDARLMLERELVEWLSPEVPASWKVPAELIDRTVLETEVRPVTKDYGTLYEATLSVDLSQDRREEMLTAYHHDLVVHRMARLGGGLAFILVCLTALSGYIRADEATKGYYTKWLRTIAAAGVGASGVLIYELLT
jgi:hypothetical protein